MFFPTLTQAVTNLSEIAEFKTNGLGISGSGVHVISHQQYQLHTQYRQQQQKHYSHISLAVSTLLPAVN